MKCKNIFSVLSSLSVFESWSKAVVGHGIEVLKVEELRIVKVDVLRANIARIRAVGLMSFRFQIPCSSECTALFRRASGESTIERTCFRPLTVRALYLSAAVVLNPLLSPTFALTTNHKHRLAKFSTFLAAFEEQSTSRRRDL